MSNGRFKFVTLGINVQMNKCSNKNNVKVFLGDLNLSMIKSGMKNSYLNNKNVIITGSSKGIGKKIAELFFHYRLIL